MSTDETEAPLGSPVKQGYAHIRHHNSNNSRRRGLVSPLKGYTTYQVVKHPDGGPLPHVPFLTKRNKYVPHTGAKQLAKLS